MAGYSSLCTPEGKVMQEVWSEQRQWQRSCHHIAAANVPRDKGVWGFCGFQGVRLNPTCCLQDDNFSSIVKSVLWGRSVFNNIRKFLQVGSL